MFSSLKKRRAQNSLALKHDLEITASENIQSNHLKIWMLNKCKSYTDNLSFKNVHGIEENSNAFTKVQ